jgi:nitrogen fixation NifU-like protein
VFTAQVLDHVINPRNGGPLDEATHYGYEGIPGDGPYVEIWLRLENDVIQDAAYRTYGCPGVIASASTLIEFIKFKSKEDVMSIQSSQIEDRIGGLPEGKQDCPKLALKALLVTLGGN